MLIPKSNIGGSETFDKTTILRGYVSTSDPENGTLTVTLEDGSRLSGVHPLHGNALATETLLNTPDSMNAPVLVIVFGEGVRRAAYCFGVYARMRDDESSPLKSTKFVNGDQGFANVGKNAHIVLRKGGVIEIKSSDLCQVRMDPKTNKIQTFALNSEFFQSPDNFAVWSMEEDPLTGAPTKAKFSLSIKPKMGPTEKKVTLSIDEYGVSLQSELPVTFEGSAIKIGNGAEQALVLGDVLHEWLTAMKDAYNAHTHGTGTGPSSAPVIPLDQIDGELSDNHKVE